MAEHPMLATYTERLRRTWDAAFASESRHGRPFARFDECGTNSPRACIITASGRRLAVLANSDASDLISAVNKEIGNSRPTVLVVENINTIWIVNLSVAWVRDDQNPMDEQFWVTHASNPRHKTGRVVELHGRI
jgi:hypothetical protein